MRWFHAVAREPLVWFFVLGASIFFVYNLASQRDRPEIVVTPVMWAEMIEGRREILGRDLTDEERGELLERHVRREILLREAVRRELYLTDGVVAKRLIEKVGYLNEVPAREPTGEELEALLRAEPERFRSPSRISFEHVYFRDDLSRADSALVELQEGEADPSSLGDTFWLGPLLEDYSASQLVPLFGWGFAEALRDRPQGVWFGPLQAGNAVHLVRITRRSAPEPLTGAQLDQRLREAWQENRRVEHLDREFESLKRQYRIVVPDRG